MWLANDHLAAIRQRPLQIVAAKPPGRDGDFALVANGDAALDLLADPGRRGWRGEYSLRVQT